MTEHASSATGAARHAETRSGLRARRATESRHASSDRGTPSGAPATATEEERTTGMLIHGLTAIVSVVSVGTLGFLTSLIVFLVYKDRSEEIRSFAANAVNIQIMTIFGLFGAVLVSVVSTVLAITVAAVILAVAVALHLMGARHARRGEPWDPPFTPRMVS